MDLLAFQRRFVKRATSPDVDTAALSLPRGNGKSWLLGGVAADAMRQIEPHEEIALLAASIEQARIVFRFTRSMLGEAGFRYLDSSTRCAITRDDGARLRVIGSNGKTAMGLVNTPLVIADEPGAWEVNGGELLHDAIQTAQGKPGSPLRAVYIGTLAPATAGWWHDMVKAGSHGSVYVQALQGDPERWDAWPEIRRCNPLVAVDARFRKKLLEERDAARRDTRLRGRFLSYRLNLPSTDESVMLLSSQDWKRVCGRPVPPANGKPVVGIDLGANRSWSSAAAVWKSGRVEAVAVAPGVPGIEAQEKRDRVPAGHYRGLVEAGRLLVADGLRVPPVPMLMGAANALWGSASRVVCDFFRVNELRDTVPGLPIQTRRTRWSEAGEDIRALRKWALDGSLAVEPASRGLLTASIAAAAVKPDDSGNVRLVKSDGRHGTARDDVAAALVLAAGEATRRANVRGPSIHVVGR